MLVVEDLDTGEIRRFLVIDASVNLGEIKRCSGQGNAKVSLLSIYYPPPSRGPAQGTF